MTDGPAFAAIDLGAESGRVVVGHLTGARIELDEANRFANRPVRLPDGLRWNLLSLLDGVLEGLSGATSRYSLRGIGTDAWGVDYGLLDEQGRLLGQPFCYRDGRTAGMVERAFGRVAAAELYAVTGTQTMPINTVFQLLADEGTVALAAASRLALVPDLFGLWLSGELANEATAASTTGLLDARSGVWALDLIGRLGLPPRLFGPLTDPGERLGTLLPQHGFGRVPVYVVGGHDTASAFLAAPVRDAHAAVLSSGTWSLLGLELSAPVLDERARACNLTNERGVDGTARLLRNVMGLWLVQECRRAWEAAGGPGSYDELYRLARACRGEPALFDPDDDDLLAPGGMPARIRRACERLGQPAPATPGEIVHSILVSLACKYRFVLHRLEAVSGREVRTVHVIGGGARNAQLCQLTADLTGRLVLAGPVEAAALGNVLVQARAAGELGPPGDLRAVAAASTDPVAYSPGDRSDAQETYGRFLALTGLAPDPGAPSLPAPTTRSVSS